MINLTRTVQMPPLTDLIWAGDVFARGCVNLIRRARKHLNATQRTERANTSAHRAELLSLLSATSKKAEFSNLVEAGQLVLVDGIFDNVGHWFRYAQLRAALGLQNAAETLLTHRHSLAAVRASARSFGFSDELSLLPTASQFMRARLAATKDLLQLRTGRDVISHAWPNGFPGVFVYDELQRKQRTAILRLDDQLIVRELTRLHATMARAEQIFSEHDIGLVVLSHSFPFEHMAMALTAMKHNIPVIQLMGVLGTTRATRLRSVEDMKRFTNLPLREEAAALSPRQQSRFRKIGSQYLDWRIAGHATDLGAAFAYQNDRTQLDRSEICQVLDWPVERPIVTIYAPCWFDTPHAHGMTRFHDFAEWAQCTVDAARENDSVSWLLRAHPAEEWYGGEKLTDVIHASDLPPHIQISDRGWHAGSIMAAADAAISIHGTVGLEFAALGKPVLLAEPGWYGPFGVGVMTDSREDYVTHLKRPWFEEADTEASRTDAELIAGLFYCVPEWQDGLIVGHDTVQDAGARELIALLQDHAIAWAHETAELREWYKSQTAVYHAFKILRSERLILPMVSSA
jgi:hypothetical protein